MPNQNAIGLYTDLTNNSDNFVADAAEAISLSNAHPDLIWSGLHALNGNDLITRDRTGSYALGTYAEYYDNFNVNGGEGFDTVSYSLAPTALFADLLAGVGEIDNADGKLYKDDTYESIEGIWGTHFDDTIFGDNGDNIIKGLNGNDTINGRGGVDFIEGGNGVDQILGGDGGDVIFGGNDGDNIWGENGADHINGEGGADTIHGGADGDVIDGGSGSDTINGDGGADTIDGGGDGDNIDGGSGNDTIYGGEGNDNIDGGFGSDHITVGHGHDVAEGGWGSDTFYIGTEFGSNWIDGGAQADKVVYEGDQEVFVDLFNGSASRSGGTDTLISIRDVETEGGSDTVWGTTGYNSIKTGGGADTVLTLGGDDFVDSGSGHDVVVGYGGNETIIAGTGNDHVSAYAGDDTIDGGWGNDEIDGGEGDDTIDGGWGKDELDGGEGDDTIDGGAKADLIIGGAGYDALTGGGGADTFLWNVGDHDGYADTISDFNGNSDFLAFGEGFFGPGVINLSSVLSAHDGWGGTVIMADSAEAGSQLLAVVLNGGQTAAIQQRIANGSIIDVDVNDAFSEASDEFQVLDNDSPFGREDMVDQLLF